MAVRIYFTPLPSGEQPWRHIERPFLEVVGAFAPGVVAEGGWPIFDDGDGPVAYNPDYVDCICEVDSRASEDQA
jgi:hypothetical protein